MSVLYIMYARHNSWLYYMYIEWCLFRLLLWKQSCVCMCACICVCVCVCARTSFATCIISKMFGTCLWCLYGTMCLNKLLKWMKFKYWEYLFKSLSHSLSVVSLYHGGQATVMDESLVMDRSASRRRIACHAPHCFLLQSSLIKLGEIITWCDTT